MSNKKKTACFNWESVKQGDTFNAINFVATGTQTDLARVRVTIKDTEGNTELSLDSATSGITLNSVTAGAWDYTIGPISSTQTGNIDVGIHHYDLETIDVGGNVKTHFQGSWEITSQTTT